MTYVEFFDKNAIANVCSCLIQAPDRVILLGEDEKLMNKHKANYQSVFSARGQTIEFICMRVSRSELQETIDVIENIVTTYNDCVFDITGGTELLNVALGVVYGRHPEMQIQRFNPRSSVMYDCDTQGKKINAAPALTIAENVKLYGGEVVFGDVSEKKTYKWELTEEFLADAEKMWSICKKDVRAWNTQIGMLETAEDEKDEKASNTLCTVASIDRIKNKGKKSKGNYVKIIGVLGPLLRMGLITDFDDTDGKKLRVTYKNEQVKRCLTTAGQILELKIYLIAKSLKDATGMPMYDDALNGVVIDWDGEYHDEKKEKVFDTENEIDVLLMHDAIPIFISCKNGIMDSDELYKLNTVAERFGGIYAKKVLVATSLDALGAKGKYLRQRAIDMDIFLIEKVQDSDDAKIAKDLKNLWTNKKN